MIKLFQIRFENSALTLSKTSFFIFATFFFIILLSNVNNLSTFILLFLGIEPFSKSELSIKTEYFSFSRLEVIPQVIISSASELSLFFDKIRTGLCLKLL